MNPKWQVWTKASFAAYIKDFCDDNAIHFTLDSIDNAVDLEQMTYINLRVPSINITERTKNQYIVSVGLEILVHASKDPKNIYFIDGLKGLVYEALNKCIPFKDLGFPDSTGETVEFFSFPKELRKPVRDLDLINSDQSSRVREIIFTAPYVVEFFESQTEF